MGDYIVRKIKESQRNKPEPVVDRIVSNRGDDIEEERIEETSGFVTLRVHSDDSDRGDMPIEIIHNGRTYVLPRDKSAKVPKEIAEILKRSAEYELLSCKVGKTQLSTGGKYLVDPEIEKVKRFNLEIERED